jgi:hypothetical protein
MNKTRNRKIKTRKIKTRKLNPRKIKPHKLNPSKLKTRKGGMMKFDYDDLDDLDDLDDFIMIQPPNITRQPSAPLSRQSSDDFVMIQPSNVTRQQIAPLSRQSSDDISKHYLSRQPSIEPLSFFPIRQQIAPLSRQSSDDISKYYLSRQPSIEPLSFFPIRQIAPLSRQSSDDISKHYLSRQPSIEPLGFFPIRQIAPLSRQPSLYSLIRQPSEELYLPQPGSLSKQTSAEIDAILSQYTATNPFTDLCNKHIMEQNLDEVVESAWLQNGQSNIFLIGENHTPHKKCVGILEMFDGLVKEVKKKNIQDIDLLIEHTQYDTLPEVIQQHKPLDSDSLQLNYVRDYFQTCILNRNCDIRVHWTDPSMSNKIEEWLYLLSREDLRSTRWINTSIFDSFNSEEDMFRLVTDNYILTKEIRAASRVVPSFTLDWVVNLFMEQYRKYSILNRENSWKTLVTLQLRHVMDFYTVARILKSQMKNVIVYAGFVHTSFICSILTKLDYMTLDRVKGKCYNLES